jgi:3D (Asp-Asp-Asp) domain-containing protein
VSRSGGPWLGACFLLALLGEACAPFARPGPTAPRPAAPSVRELEVTATAYNSRASQTEGDPNETASGERLGPGVRALAVSDDLFEGGLGFGARVEIEGLPGEWIVMDRMHSRWRRKIDVYLGNDVDAAKRFGEKRVRIRWRPPE